MYYREINETSCTVIHRGALLMLFVLFKGMVCYLKMQSIHVSSQSLEGIYTVHKKKRIFLCL